MDFYFKQNHYSEMYLFKRPERSHFGDGELNERELESWNLALADYERCKSYVTDF